MTFPNPGPASQSTGNVAGGPYVAWSGTNTTAQIGPAGVLVPLGAGVGGGVALYDGANSITSGTAQFSNANGVTFGFNAQTVTASVAGFTQSNQTVASGGIAGSGFTTATTAGTAVVGTQDSGGLSLGIPKYLTTYTPGAAQTAISSIADSANTQTVGMLSFANSNGISFGILTGALTATITASANSANPGISSIADGAGTQTLGMLSFANANGVTFGLSTGANTGTLTASVNFAGLLSSVVFSASNTSTANTGLTFSNSNGLSFGLNNGTITGSYTVPSIAGLISGVNISGGASSAVVSAVTFSNLNGVSFGYDKTNITASIGSMVGGGTTFAGANLSGSMTLNTGGLNISLSAANPGGAVPISRLIYPSVSLVAGGQFTNASLSIIYLPVAVPVTASRLDMLFEMAGTSSATAATMGLAWSAYAGISTLNVSTLASLSSGSTQTTYTFQSNNAGATYLTGTAIRPISVPMNMNLTPGEYFVGVNLVTNTTSIGLTTTSLGFAFSIMSQQGSFLTAANYAEIGNVTATSNNLASGAGLLSVATTGMPTSVALSNINATGANLVKAGIALVFRNV